MTWLWFAAYHGVMSPASAALSAMVSSVTSPGVTNPAVPDASSGAAPAAGALTEQELAVLAFERQWWKYAGAKEQAVGELFGMTGTRYYQVLNALIDRPEALDADPMLVKRLRRQRSTRQRARSARRLGAEA